MSKLGVHVSAGNRTGFGPFLKQCAVAGSPVPVVFTLDQDVWPDVSQLSPLTAIIFRTQPDGNDNPLDIYTGDTSLSALDWYVRSKKKWQLNHAHYYAPLNEPNPHGEAQCKWLSDFIIAFLNLAETDGYLIAAFGASAGTPEYSDWEFLRPAMKRMKQGSHVLLLHEYGLERGTLCSSAPDLALRYREVRYLLGDDCPDIVIGEASGGAGYSAGDDAAWLHDVQWYDSELMLDRYVLSACLYQLGGAENFQALLPQLSDYIASHPTVQPIEPVGPTLEEQVETLELQTADLESRMTSLEVESNARYAENGRVDAAIMADLAALTKRVAALEQPSPQPPPVPSPTMHAVPVGLHDRADGEDHNAPYFPLELQCVDIARIRSLMIHTGDTFESFDAFISNGVWPDLCVLGLTMAGDDPSLGKPDVYYNLMHAWLTRFYLRGGRYVEVHNEPNLPDEGFGLAWKTVSQFGGWFDTVARSIHADFPQMHVIFPAISINGVTPAQMTEWLSTMQSSLLSGTANLIGCHAYWQDAAGIESIESGRAYRKFAGLRNGSQLAQLYLTEVANVGTVDSDATKGAQYKAYCAQIETQVAGVVFFCSSASNKAFNETRQTWIRNGAVTGIARAVGA